MDKYIGKLLDDRYDILELIGTGGMANVYKAQCRLLKRFVAVKILKDEFACDEEFRKRFHNESEAVAMLSHHNIVSVYDVSKSDDLEYIVMELVDGLTLKEYMRRKGKLDWKEVLFFAAQISAALNHAHSRGIIHQDIKPHNVMVLQNGEVKVTDFGIARRFRAIQETRVVQEAIGSVHYMAPEQAKGGKVDPRTDLYSLGVVMYEMLTGRLPFEGENPLAIVVQHINAIPLMPSELDASIPRAMDEIVMKAMCPQPQNRYANAEEIYSDLIAIKNNPNIDFGYTMESTGRGSLNHDLAENRTVRYSTAELAEEEEKQMAPSGNQKRKKQGSTMRIPILVTSIAVLAFVVVAFLVIRSLLTSTAPVMIEIPDFLGKTVADVVDNPEYEMFEFEIAEEVIEDDTVEDGTILKQSPRSGRKIEKNEDKILITLTLSGEIEEEKRLVPSVVGMNYQLASIEFLKAEITNIKQVQENSSEVESGYIIRTLPVAGTEIGPDDVLEVVVSMGPEVKLVKMPYLIGMTRDEAESELISAGLVANVTEMESAENVGKVIKQSIPKNVEVSVGTVVDVEVAIEKEEPDPPPEAKGTATLVIPLPTDKTQVHVTAKVGAQTVYDATVDTAQGSVSVTLQGNIGSVLAVVTIDGYTYEQVLEFK